MNLFFFNGTLCVDFMNRQTFIGFRIVEVLKENEPRREKKGEVGIDRLVEEGVFSAAYPLHDV